MKKSAMFPSLALVCAIAAGAFAMAAEATAKVAPRPSKTVSGPAGAGFDKLKSLAGEWQAQSPEGEPVTVTYALVSGGTAVQEEIGHGSMISVYHLDGDSLMMTHYCMENNQPRMRAKGLSADGRTLDFKFVDATNLAKPTEGHMHGLKLTFVDDDHITAEWVYSADGKEEPETFHLARKK